ncbi:MAG: hypothetical protein IIB00_10070, partial [candidate division Zixibacteria bacterium]|nr:hypothetical protein [candidate division Zixibacteria bacterium]
RASFVSKPTYSALGQGDNSYLSYDDEFDNFSNTPIVGRKSALKAGALSLLVPGLGQLYNGSHIAKIALFAGAEAGLWIGYAHYHNKGYDQVAEFESFADNIWSEEEYFRYLQDVYGANIDTGIDFSHHLPLTKTQQYYEMIGKYEQFSYGWSLAEGDTIVYSLDPSFWKYPTNPYPTDLRITYNDMRGSANDTFASRDRMINFAIINHILSAVDAALTARSINSSLSVGGGQLSIMPTIEPTLDYSFMPHLKMNFVF